MPWSEWQTGPTRIQSYLRHARAELEYGGLLIGHGWGTYTANPVTDIPSLMARLSDVEEDPYGYGTVETQSRGIIYTRPDSWRTWRDWFPIALSGLEEGVDYGIRPDRTDADDDAYVQYEDGDNTVVDFLRPTLRYTDGSAGGDPDGVPGEGSWALGIAPMPTLPVVPSGDNAFTVGTWPGPGSVFLTGGVETAPTSHSSSYPDITSLDHFLISPMMTGAPNIFGTGSNVKFSTTDPGFRYQTPRWRYWIPRDLPLRQKQRDDGLALRGAPSWRQGSSRQASNRWRSYL